MGLPQSKDKGKERDREVVLDTWREIEDEQKTDELVHTIYTELLHRNEGVRNILAQVTFTTKRRMVTTIMNWIAEMPSEDKVHSTAVQHAHIGVRATHVASFCDCLATCVAQMLRYTPGGERTEESVVGAWERTLKTLVSVFSETCEGAFESLQQAKDMDINQNDTGKNAKAIKTVRSAMTQANPHAKSGYLSMSQYSCLNMKPPKTAENHRLDCFRRRWIELHSQYVYYFRKKGDEKPIGLVDLASCQLIDTNLPNSPLPNPFRFSFALRTQAHDYPYYFIADGDNTKEDWFSKLRVSCNRFSLVRSDLNKGDRVKLWTRQTGAYEYGICRWIGQIESEIQVASPYATGTKEGKDGLWVGVELLEAHGDCDGTVNGHEYFTCAENHGLLVPANTVINTSSLEIQVQGEKLSATSYKPEDFDFLCVLGKGSFGRVCKVREKAVGKIYACKVLQKAALQKESHIKNITREKSLLLNIRHPYIVKLHAAFQTRGRLFLLFDFLSGGELFFHMTQCPRGFFPEQRAQFYIAEISLAIHHLHTKNIIHRDLKAENMVLDADGHVVLTDFGFAKTIEADVANTTKCGTLPYMAPEMLHQGPNGYAEEVDWWALGVLLFLMLTGCYPFWSKNPKDTVRQILHRQITRQTFPAQQHQTNESVEVVAGLLNKNPARRLCAEAFFNDPWFRTFDWQACRDRELQPPFVPVSSGRNTKYFDPQDVDVKHHSGMVSTVLPQTWQGAEAFASFYDVHTDYKQEEEAKEEVPDVNEEEEDSIFIKNLNQPRTDVKNDSFEQDRYHYILDT